jgi:Mrp family chromosome partitioning ATPase
MAAASGAPLAGSQPAEPEIEAEDDAGSTAGRSSVVSANVALALRPRGVTQMARNLPGPQEVEAERDRADLEEELVRLVELVRVHRMAPPWTIDPRLLMLVAPDSAAAAGFRVLRQRLSEREGVRSILVTSSRPEEGKTLCAVNLALALGEAGRARVVLLEANFRHPSLARLLGFRPTACIGEQLEARRTRSAPWVVTEVGVPWMHTAVVAPGAKAGPIFDGKEFALFVEDLREAGYDYVVIDGPPILGSADANLLQESVDGVLLTMRAGKSRGRTLLKAVEQIGGGKLLGVALLGT